MLDAVEVSSFSASLRLLAEYNVFRGVGSADTAFVAQHRPLAMKNWVVRRNLTTNESPAEHHFIVTEFVPRPKYISDTPTDRDFLRLPADSPHPGTGPNDYYGALPPGPAPKEGDWCTRLRERWKDVPKAP
jgi:hypothetical protein